MQIPDMMDNVNTQTWTVKYTGYTVVPACIAATSQQLT